MKKMKYLLLLALMLLTVGGVYAAEGSIAKTKDVTESETINIVSITTPNGPHVQLVGNQFMAKLQTDRRVTISIRIGIGDGSGSVCIGSQWYEISNSSKIIKATLSPNSEIYGYVYSGNLSLRLESVEGADNQISSDPEEYYLVFTNTSR